MRTVDVSAVKHHVLQHLPVSAASPVRGSAPLYCPLLSWQPTCYLCRAVELQNCIMSRLAAAKGECNEHLCNSSGPPVVSFLQDQQRSEPSFVNSVYLDNSSLELYHGLLDKKPGATTMRIRQEMFQFCVVLGSFCVVRRSLRSSPALGACTMACWTCIPISGTGNS